ncbi:PadR family transcriptional regulator, regulatory protein PadR [Asanoa hainanensis]|uniref:PadR family transcriptional regulator, regulatory protein PadR n=1 Tax=Asanoa hainanensis TaxID=560556 RepID=A0A239PHU7_9ACTN|nr:PadR family transcriptional regulator [Asanoa hainanensis]SNT66178.1 PadR family transcriptional regulator, regulatory protein PadR [Asanoa hainanensis]
MTPVEGGERHTQLLRGALDMCMLALLAKEPAHGYELVRRLDEAGLDAGGYGTVYPLLTRMRRLGLVEDETQESPSGPRRKVYKVTPAGHHRLGAWRQQWQRFVTTVDATLADTSGGGLE